MVALAAACALIVPPAAFVERSYSNGAFRWMQPVITGVSNLLRETVAFDSTMVSRPSLVALAERAVAEMNRIAPTLPSTWPSTREMERALAPAFAKAEATIGAPWHSMPARTKVSLLSPYFRAVGHNGIAIPVFWGSAAESHAPCLRTTVCDYARIGARRRTTPSESVARSRNSAARRPLRSAVVFSSSGWPGG